MYQDVAQLLIFQAYFTNLFIGQLPKQNFGPFAFLYIQKSEFLVGPVQEEIKKLVRKAL